MLERYLPIIHMSVITLLHEADQLKENTNDRRYTTRR